MFANDIHHRALMCPRVQAWNQGFGLWTHVGLFINRLFWIFSIEINITGHVIKVIVNGLIQMQRYFASSRPSSYLMTSSGDSKTPIAQLI